jgi:hypothetical protein
MLDHRTSRVHMHCWEGLGTKNARLSPDMALLFCMALACEHLAEFLRSCHPNKAGLLFATRNGTPWDANMVLKRHLKPLFRELNIAIPKGNGFHAFRHANASMMDRFGTPLKVRQERLDHNDSRITQNVYTLVYSAEATRVASQLGEALWGPIRPLNGLQNEKAGLEPETQTPRVQEDKLVAEVGFEPTTLGYKPNGLKFESPSYPSRCHLRRVDLGRQASIDTEPARERNSRFPALGIRKS